MCKQTISHLPIASPHPTTMLTAGTVVEVDQRLTLDEFKRKYCAPVIGLAVHEFKVPLPPPVPSSPFFSLPLPPHLSSFAATSYGWVF